jgi:hypothetical protein
VKDPILKPLQSLLATAVSAKRIDVAEQSIATPFAPVKWAPTLAFVYDDVRLGKFNTRGLVPDLMNLFWVFFCFFALQTSILPLLAAKADAKKDPSKANKSDKRGGRNAEAAQGEETGGKKKESAHAKLQQALENQVRSLYKRLRTDNAPFVLIHQFTLRISLMKTLPTFHRIAESSTSSILTKRHIL